MDSAFVFFIVLGVVILICVATSKLNKYNDSKSKKNVRRITTKPIVNNSKPIVQENAPNLPKQRNKSLYQGYSDLRWKNKCLTILARDNYTCQHCKKNDPSKGFVFHSQQETINGKEIQYYEIHEYNYLSGHYYIYSTKDNIKVGIELSDKIVMPILQVHHKRYIEGFNVWENEDDDLITLCQGCHQKEHDENQIPITTLDGEFIRFHDLGMMEPNQRYDEKNIRNFKPWSIVKGHYSTGWKYVKSISSTRFYALSLNTQDAVHITELTKNIVMRFFAAKFPMYDVSIGNDSVSSSPIVLDDIKVNKFIQFYNYRNEEFIYMDCIITKEGHPFPFCDTSIISIDDSMINMKSTSREDVLINSLINIRKEDSLKDIPNPISIKGKLLHSVGYINYGNYSI